MANSSCERSVLESESSSSDRELGLDEHNDSARFDEDGSSSREGDAVHHDQRADLARMVSRRHFAVFDGADKSHHRRASSGTAAAALAAAGAHQKHYGHRRTRTAASGKESSCDDEGHSNQVLEFFRTVNKDAHLLKRASSDGVHGCGASCLRAFASCLRRLGMGNPGASVENMAFHTNDPLDFSMPNSARRSSAFRGGSVRGSIISAEGVLEEDLEEDDDEADEEELSAQKKKVHDLGELPALDWSNASIKVLATLVLVGVILLTTYSGWIDSLKELQWLNGLCMAVGAYIIVELLVKALAGFFKWTRLLHTSNKVWIFIKLHRDVSLFISSVVMLVLWWRIDGTDWAPNDDGVIAKILGVFLAYTSTHIVSEVCKVEMAHLYMWKPYLQRARASIWSQYVIFTMTDYAMGLQGKDVEGQALALGFTKAKKNGEHLSLYTVGKAIGFVHANALRHPLGPGRPGTDREGMIDSKIGARLFGGLLFDALMLNFHDEDQKPLSIIPLAGGNSQDKDKPINAKSPRVELGLPRPFAHYKLSAPVSTVQPATHGGGGHNGNMPQQHGPLHRKLSAVPESDNEEQKEADGPERGVEEGEEDDDDGGSTSTEGQEACSTSKDAGATAKDTTVITTAIKSDTDSYAPRGGNGLDAGGAPAGHRRSGGKHASTGGAGALARHKGIRMEHLRRMSSKPVALKIMELFEVPPDEVITRKEFVDRIVDIFVQRRGLQLTLADYEAILKKVGILLSVISYVAIFFIALRILGYNIGSLVLTWLSLAVAFSFLFGSSASAFFESIIFIFVTKAYDVGDPVYFVDDMGADEWYIVTRINMLTTVFRRWDGEATLMANNIMAKKAIRNQWRSGQYLHHTTIAMSVDTPMEKLDQMKAGMAAGLRRGRHRHKHGIGGLMPDSVDYQIKNLADGNRMSVFVMCRQRENCANMSRRFANANLLLKLMVRECNRLGITYTLPAQPITAKAGMAEALNVREAFLGGKPGDADARR